MSELFQSLRIALRALRGNKMRSFLTMLGIIIGIAAVITMVAVGNGARHLIGQQIASMGSNLILVMPGSSMSGGMRMGSGSVQTLTLDDARALSELSPVEAAAPIYRGSGQIVYANMNWSTQVLGITPEFLTVREWALSEGRELYPSDVEGATKTCLVGKTVAENLFGDENPVGKVIRIKKVPFTVVGVLSRKGQSPQGTDQDDVVAVPVTTAQRKLFASRFPTSVSAIMVRAAGQELLPRAEEEVTAMLSQRHRISATREQDFTVRNLSEMLAVAEQSSKVMSILLGSVASISLLVGGIGIMNIMLVSVTERTREIGIRMAIGAKKQDILLQFLTEAVLLTATGGVIGIILGVGAAAIVSKVLEWPALTSVDTALVAFLFSAAIGVFFGLYPARKAAGLNPIDALRYE